MKLWLIVLTAVVGTLALFMAAYFASNHSGGERSGLLTKTAWQRMASPGALSEAHTFLEHNCAACHTAVKGAQAANCIVCHANDESILQRQPTAFHADVQSCVPCHIEHQGIDHRPTMMDHAALAEFGLKQIERQSRTEPSVAAAHQRLVSWIEQRGTSTTLPPGHSELQSMENALNCAMCHRNQDRHQSLFGADCIQCHTTTAWTIPVFRHPSPRSTDCAQCHQAPPSHYMMHFQMVSMKIAGRAHAQVNQCFLCHQTTSWNDIRGVGWYKHH